MLDSKVYTLLKVAETGSFTAAARELSLTQPAVSHHIRTLERDYTVTIFKKDKKSLIMTAEGEILLKYAKRMAAIDQDVRRSIEDSWKQSTHLTIGITQTAGENMMPRVIARYCDDHPETHIKIHTDTINNLYRKMALYELDLAFVEGILPNNRFPSVLLDTDYLCLAVSLEHRFAKRQEVRLEEIKDEKLILRPQTAGTRMLFENFLWSQRESIQNFNIVMELDNLAMTKELVAQNFGVSIIARSACREDIRQGRLAVLPIENGSMVREIHMIYQPDFSHMQILEDFQRIYNTLY
ncbi:LysR family transcriptional regulator [Lacrimispora sp. NSJ-141]|uniref:LysR family transcriptional regulator n=1 Tax=Lientehia hominis TaxID=2897778 RepID=A0AAP2RJG2_9FIRM|nr:LysR family transcriptional regulator [Lientehia hominis]MCD2492544.1 LysR family transcriptional regulator [Lientehia hominis]